MSMKDLLSKMTELQGTQASVEVAPVTTTGKKVLNESSNTVKESTKPSLKGIFNTMLSEADQKERLDEVIFFSPAGLINSGMSAETALLSAFVVYAAGAAYMAFSPSFKYYRQDLINRFNDFRDSGKLDKGAIAELEKKAESIINSLPSSKKRMLNQLVKQLSSVKDDKSQLLKTIRRIESYIEKNKTELDEAEQVTIQPAKQNTQVIKQGQKTLGTVENPQLAQQIKQSIGKGEMTLAGDELGEAKVTDSRVNEIRQVAKQFFGIDPYSSARIDNGKILRLSFILPKMNEYYRYVPLDSIDPKDKQYLTNLKKDFLQYMAEKGVSSEEVDMKFHVGSGIYASVRIAIPQETTEPNLEENEATPPVNNSKLADLTKIDTKTLYKLHAVMKHRGTLNDKSAQGAQVSAKRAADELLKRGVRVDEAKLTEKAVSKSQQQAAGAALAAKRGDAPKSKLKGASKEMAKMPAKELEKFAKTKHKGLPEKKKTDEAAMPTHDGDFGAGLGAGRNSKTLESKKAKPDYIDLDKDGNKKESMKKAAADKQKVSTMKKTNEAKAKPDFLDLDKDGNKKESMKKAAADTKVTKKKVAVKEGSNPTEAAKLLGKAHALGKDPFACKYEMGSQEAQAYLDGYKEGLDECYGSGGGMGMQQDIGMMPGMVSMADTSSPRGGSDFEVDSMDNMGGFGGFDSQPDEADMIAFESWDRQLNSLLNEGKMKDIDIDMKEMSAADFKKEYKKTKEEMRKELGADKKVVKEGMTVSISKGNQGMPDSVTISAQDSEADQLLSLIKQAGLGLFGGADTAQTSAYGAPVQSDAGSQSVYPDSNVDTGDHDGMIALMKKVSGNDYEDEESQDDEQAYGHPDAACDVCGSSDCGCDSESDSKALVVGEDETEDQMEFEVSEDSAGQEEEEMTTADEDAEAKEDQALATADANSDDEEEIDEGIFDRFKKKEVIPEPGTVIDVNGTEVTIHPVNNPDYIGYSWVDSNGKERYEETRTIGGDYKIDVMQKIRDEIESSEENLTEWANDAGYTGSENTKDNTFEQDIEFMTRVISGGLNNQKKDQTTLPHTRVKVEESSLLNDWKKLSGIK